MDSSNGLKWSVCMTPFRSSAFILLFGQHIATTPGLSGCLFPLFHEACRPLAFGALLKEGNQDRHESAIVERSFVAILAEPDRAPRLGSIRWGTPRAPSRPYPCWKPIFQDNLIKVSLWTGEPASFIASPSALAALTYNSKRHLSIRDE
jgi:hypothetical protein